MIHLVQPIRQWHGYDCGAAVLRMGVQFTTDRRLSHRDAIRETDCRPDGVSFTRLKQVFRAHGVSVGRLDVRSKVIRAALDENRLVVIDDNARYSESHVILIVGYTRTRFWVIDPIIGLPTMRQSRRVIGAAETAFAIAAKREKRRVSPSTR